MSTDCDYTVGSSDLSNVWSTRGSHWKALSSPGDFATLGRGGEILRSQIVVKFFSDVDFEAWPNPWDLTTLVLRQRAIGEASSNVEFWQSPLDLPENELEVWSRPREFGHASFVTEGDWRGAIEP